MAKLNDGPTVDNGFAHLEQHRYPGKRPEIYLDRMLGWMRAADYCGTAAARRECLGMAHAFLDAALEAQR